MSESADDRSMEATPRRRQEARREGRVARSPALSSTIVVVGGLAVLMTLGDQTAETICNRFQIHLGGQAALSVNGDSIATQWQQTVFETLKALLPLLSGFFGVAVLANLVQTGVVFLPKNVVPSFSRLNPWSGVRRIFSSSNFISVVLGLLQLVVAGLVVWWCVRTDLVSIVSLSTTDAEGILKSAGRILFSAAMKVALGLFATALLDYAYRRWNYERELRMTPQQQRDESRMSESDPQLSSRRRQIHARIGQVPAKANVEVVEGEGRHSRR